MAAGLRKAKLRVYVTVEGQEVDGEAVEELVVDYQRVENAGALSGVWTIVRATAWGGGTLQRLAMWTQGQAPQWVIELVGRYSPDQELAELQGLGGQA